ncbi:MAG: hypothetical protein H6793_03225 [Candidatus Nomurabacteria bacterium]|nr:MAG: hypothetical protein H6793_03225 [Candidatus Nomurabacteria bacterium]
MPLTTDLIKYIDMQLEHKDIKKALHKERSLPKKIGVDILGVLLIIASGLVGWLPGPGGIPLFLGGLALLASNHEWAERLINSLGHHGNRLSEIIFSEKPRVQLIFDIISFLLFTLSCYVISTTRSTFFKVLFSGLMFTSIWLFIGNRKRLQRISKQIKQKRQK